MTTLATLRAPGRSEPQAAAGSWAVRARNLVKPRDQLLAASLYALRFEPFGGAGVRLLAGAPPGHPRSSMLPAPMNAEHVAVSVSRAPKRKRRECIERNPFQALSDRQSLITDSRLVLRQR